MWRLRPGSGTRLLPKGFFAFRGRPYSLPVTLSNPTRSSRAPAER